MPYVIRKLKDASPTEVACGMMRKLTGPKDCHGMDMVHVTIKNSTKKHYHKKLTEVYYVLKGAIDIELDGKVEHLKKGEMVMIFPNTNHKAWKKSKSDTEILVICCPPWSEADEIFVE